MTETLFVYISATASFIFLCVGVFAGWTVNEKMHEYLYVKEAENERLHPEMYDEEGQWINEELLSVRFVDEDFDDE
jgi:hypothetical protein|tara:strand:- start:1445 stop:1672 length:228 start_codon:yes stop_codon:yes gene_type:complete